MSYNERFYASVPSGNHEHVRGLSSHLWLQIFLSSLDVLAQSCLQGEETGSRNRVPREEHRSWTAFPRICTTAGLSADRAEDPASV